MKLSQVVPGSQTNQSASGYSHRATGSAGVSPACCRGIHLTPAKRRRSQGGSPKIRLTNHVSAFSLLELLLVVAILVILTTFYWNSNSGSRQKKSYADCETNLQKIYIAMEVFSNEHDSKFPEKTGARVSGEALSVLVPRYTSDNSLFVCPASKNHPLPPGDSLEHHTISYAYYMGRRGKDPGDPLMSDKQIDTRSKAIGQGVFSISGKPPGNNHGKSGGNFLFCDGHVQQSPPNAAFSLVLTQGMVLLNP